MYYSYYLFTYITLTIPRRWTHSRGGFAGKKGGARDADRLSVLALKGEQVRLRADGRRKDFVIAGLVFYELR